MQKQFTSPLIEIGKIPPQAVEVEEAFLGAILIDSDIHHLIDKCRPELFYKEVNQRVFNAARKLKQSRQAIDILTVTDQLRTDGVFEIVGMDYIMKLSNKVNAGFHAEEHLYILYEKFILRESIRLSSEMMQIAYSDVDIEEIEQKLNEMQTFFNETTSQGINGCSFGTLIDQSKSMAEQRKLNRMSGIQNGIQTGIGALDDIIGGWQKSDLVFIAARPSMGKTAVAVHFAKRAAMSGKKTLFFSLEMSRIQLTDRGALGETKINPEKWRNGDISKEDIESYNELTELVGDWPLYIYDKSAIRTNEVYSICRKEIPDIIFIDYIQLMRVGNGVKLQNRNLELGQISHDLKMIAKDFNIPVIALCQLNRGIEMRNSKIPSLADLRDSGELEQDADLVIFPYRPYVYSQNTDDSGKIDFIIAKHRNGRVGTVEARHNDYLNRFFDQSDLVISDVPF